MSIIKAVLKYVHRCVKCGHEWESEVEYPKYCPRCGTRKWDKVKEGGTIESSNHK